MLDGDTPSPASAVCALSQPDSVRVATIHDERRIFDFLWEHLYADNDMGIPRDQTRVWEHVNQVCRGRGICGVIEENCVVIGSIGIVPFVPWYSNQFHLSEVWLTVRPDARKGSHCGEALFQFARWHRADMEARLGYPIGIELSVHSFKRLDAKERLWSRFAKKIGGVFWMSGEQDHGR